MMNGKCKSLLQIPNQQKCASAALLFLRLVVGIAFIYHGWGKMQSPMSWMPPGAPVPGFFQLLAAISEFGGGIALVLGLLTRIAMLGLGFTMLVATSMLAFVNHAPFISMSGGPAFELPLVYLAIAVLIFNIGPGKFSVDERVFGTK